MYESIYCEGDNSLLVRERNSCMQEEMDKYVTKTFTPNGCYCAVHVAVGSAPVCFCLPLTPAIMVCVCVVLALRGDIHGSMGWSVGAHILVHMY